jgi:alkylation response protein AidB-like acyl-CoA dehydrogenase
MSTTSAPPRQAAEFIEADFSLSPDQERMRADLEALVRDGLGEQAAAWEQQAVFPPEALRTLATAGVLGLPVPRGMGGRDRGWIENGIALRALSNASGSVALIVHLQNTLTSLLAQAAPAHEGLIDAVVRGNAALAFAHREPGGRTDLAPVSTSYRASGDGYLLRGVKRAVLFGPHATHLLITAVPEGGAPRRNGSGDGMSVFVVDATAPGVRVTPARSRGLRAMGNAEVALDGVIVPSGALVGGTAAGEDLVRYHMRCWRGLRAPFDIATALWAVLLVVEDAKRKITFGKPLLKYQVIQFRLMDSQAKLELTEPMGLYLQWLADTGRSPATLPLSLDGYAAMVHLLAARYSRKAFEDAIEIGGGRMFNENHPVWQRYMDSIVLRVLDGVESVDLDLIAREYLGAAGTAERTVRLGER